MASFKAINNYPIGGKIFDGQWNFLDCIFLMNQQGLSGGSFTTCSIASYIPNDGYDYEVLICSWTWGMSLDQTGEIRIHPGTVNSSNAPTCGWSMDRALQRNYVQGYPCQSCLVPIKANDRAITVHCAGNNCSTSVSLVGYRRLGGTLNKYPNLSEIQLPNKSKYNIATENLDGAFITKKLQLANWTTSIASHTRIQYDLTTYLPSDQNQYEVILSGCIRSNGNDSSSLDVYLPGADPINNPDHNRIKMMGCRQSGNTVRRSMIYTVIDTSHLLNIYAADSAAEFCLHVAGYRRIGMNEKTNNNYIGNLNLDGNDYCLMGYHNDGPWIISHHQLFNSGLNENNVVTLSLQNILPNDGYDYMVSYNTWTSCNGNDYRGLHACSGTGSKSDFDNNLVKCFIELLQCDNFAQHGDCTCANGYIPIYANDRNITLYSTHGGNTVDFRILAYRRIGTNTKGDN